MSDPEQPKLPVPARAPGAPLDCIPPDRDVGISLASIFLNVQDGKHGGFVYGDRANESAINLGYDVDMIVVGVRMHRRLFGVDYNDAVKGGMKQKVVCRSVDGVTGHGIGRMLLPMEIQALKADPDDLSWAADVKTRTCQDLNGRAVCSAACGDPWLCRPRFEMIGLLRSHYDQVTESFVGPLRDFAPFLWEYGGNTIARVDGHRKVMKTLRMTQKVTYQAQRIQLPPHLMMSQVTLEEIKGKKGLYPKFGSVTLLNDSAKVIDEMMEFDPILTAIYEQAVDGEIKAIERLGKPREDRDAAPVDVKAPPMVSDEPEAPAADFKEMPL